MFSKYIIISSNKSDNNLTSFVSVYSYQFLSKESVSFESVFFILKNFIDRILLIFLENRFDRIINALI